MFRGPKPEAQPRTLRSIAEDKNVGSNFSNAGPPAPLPYKDSAQVATINSSDAARPVRSSADKSPFTGLRRG